MPSKPVVEELRKDKDLEGLLKALRYPGSPLIRAQAAQALGQLNNSLAVESLIRSTQLDPAAEVQAAARQALEEMFGTNARNVIQAYPIYADEEPWILEKKAVDPVEELENEEEDEWSEEEDENQDGKDADDEDQDEEGLEDDDEAESGWTSDDLGPLITILRSERDPRLRLRAARALGKLGATNMHAVEALAATALWGEKPSVRAAALQALVKIYGDEDTDRLLDTFRQMQTVQSDPQAIPEADQDGEEIDGEPEADAFSGWNRPAQALPQPIPYDQHEPVMREEGGGHLRQIMWIGIIVLVILGMVLIFNYFK
jgi:HEAT repeat protein